PLLSMPAGGLEDPPEDGGVQGSQLVELHGAPGSRGWRPPCRVPRNSDAAVSQGLHPCSGGWAARGATDTGPATAATEVNRRVEIWMTRDVSAAREARAKGAPSIASTDSLRRAAERMTANGVHALLVVGEDDEPFGLLRASDVVRAVAQGDLVPP